MGGPQFLLAQCALKSLHSRGSQKQPHESPCLLTPDKALFCVLQLCGQCFRAGTESQSCHHSAERPTNPTPSLLKTPQPSCEVGSAKLLFSLQSLIQGRNSWCQAGPGRK